jgi:hypothetical protein
MADWNPSKRDANYLFAERNFDGASAMWLKKSQDEAPEVGIYDYNNVEIQAYDNGATSMEDFSSQWTTTLFGDNINTKDKTSERATVDINTLLNDVWFCVMIDDYSKMTNLLERARIMGVHYPADYPIQNMFGSSTLWTRINDSEFKISGATRDKAINILRNYHQ